MRKMMMHALAGVLAVVAVGQSAFAQTSITVVAYSGIFQERYTKAVIEPFMRAHPDIRVNYYPVTTSAQMLGTLRAQKAAPQADVILMDVSVAKAGSDEGLFVKLDEQMIPNISRLFPAARIPGVAGPAVTYDNVVLMYNTDHVKEPPKSWNALADKAYAGKVVIPGVPDIRGLALLFILDAANGGKDYLKNVDKGIAAMAAIAPNVLTWEPKPDVFTPIVSGLGVIGVEWNARAQINADSTGGKVRSTLPQEGSVLQINTINLVAGAPNAEAAKKFIDYAIGAVAQKSFTEEMFYAPTNAQAKISDGAAARTALNSLDKMIPVDWIAFAQVRDKVTEEWRRRVVPLSR